MIYWHIQMYKPSGRSPDGIQIDSEKMLREETPIIGTGEWNDTQCRQFKGHKEVVQIFYLFTANG